LDWELLKLWAQLGVVYLKYLDEYELAIAIIEGIENRAVQGQYQVERFMFN
jgi:hypothetical protein